MPLFSRCDTEGQQCSHLACGDHNTVVLTRAGRVLVAGDNSHGQCGLLNAEPARCAKFQVRPELATAPAPSCRSVGKAGAPILDWNARTVLELRCADNSAHVRFWRFVPGSMAVLVQASAA